VSDSPDANADHKVVAIIPCRNGESSVGATIESIEATGSIDEILVIDDGSRDNTAVTAYNCGARVVRLEQNQGKAAAMVAGIDAAPDADIFLFVDADTGSSAAAAVALLAPILDDQADLVIAVLPSAGGKGGLGLVRDLAKWGIHRAARAQVKAPLSGQRAVKADLMRQLAKEQGLAPRFGVEVAMTIDALNAGWRVAEVDVDMTHDHRGRTLAGFLHRGGQGRDVIGALWYRAFPLWLRLLPIAAITVLLVVACGLAAVGEQRDTGSALPRLPVVNVVLVPDASWSSVVVNVDSQALGSVVTGDAKNVFNVVEAGSRDKKATPSPFVRVSTESDVPPPTSTPTLVVGVTTVGEKAALRPMILQSAGIHGTLTSPSTKRNGLVDITDIAPTVLTMEGRTVPNSMTGTAMRVLPRTASTISLDASNQMAQFYDRINPLVIVTFVWVQIIAFVWALLAARKHNQLPAARWVATAISAFPLATYLTRWFLNTHALNFGLWALVCLAFTAALAFFAAYETKSNLAPLQRILFATIIAMVLDVLTGSHLQLSGVFGSSPTLGARYHGLGNPASELLLLASVLWVGLHVQTSPSRADALWSSAALLLVVTIAVGAPGLGSDVGGLFTMVVTSTGLMIALYLRRLPWKWLITAAAGALIALVAASWLDYQRAPDARTHLGRLTARVVNEGPSPLVSTIGRKIDVNILAYGFPWSLGVVAIVGFMLIGLLQGKWNSAFPLQSSQRVALIAALAGSAVAYAVNDSGIVVLALVSVFVGPYVLVEYRHSRPKSELTGSKLEVVVP
jgi:hypothetical protein